MPNHPDSALGAPPQDLTPVARAFWDETVPRLAENLMAVDRGAMIVLCEAWAVYQQAIEELRRIPAKDRHRGNQAWTRCNWRAEHAEKRYLRFAGQFGLTPTSRANGLKQKDRRIVSRAREDNEAARSTGASTRWAYFKR